MIESTDQTLAVELESAVRAVPGVTALFRTGGIIAKVVDAGAQILGIEDSQSSLVRVRPTQTGLHVDVAIGIDGGAGAVETTRGVESAIRALAASRGRDVAGIHVTVVHIDDETRLSS